MEPALDGQGFAPSTIHRIWKAFDLQPHRIVADRGYRSHNAPPDYRFKVSISAQKRCVTEHIKRELRRRPAVEPVIGHAKGERRMGRNYLASQQRDAANAVLAAAGCNFRRLLARLKLWL